MEIVPAIAFKLEQLPKFISGYRGFRAGRNVGHPEGAIATEGPRAIHARLLNRKLLLADAIYTAAALRNRGIVRW